MKCDQCGMVKTLDLLDLKTHRCENCRRREPSRDYIERKRIKAIIEGKIVQAIPDSPVCMNVFASNRLPSAGLDSRLPTLEDIARIISKADDKTLTTLPGSRMMESFRVGEIMVCRYTFPITTQNNPFEQSAEDLVRAEECIADKETAK